MACEIIWEEWGILFNHSGTVDEQEALAMIGIMYADSRFDMLRYQISDFTKVTNNLLTFKDAKILGTLDRASSRWNTRRMRLAFITEDEKFIPIVEYYFKEFEGTLWEGKLFESLEIAYHWVNSD